MGTYLEKGKQWLSQTSVAAIRKALEAFTNAGADMTEDPIAGALHALSNPTHMEEFVRIVLELVRELTQRVPK